jgi:DNA-binding response OmpR family regulator
VRVLVVDDDPGIVAFIRLALEDEGYEVRTAPNGQEALQRAAEFAPHVILLDMNMPVMSGWEFAEAYAERAPPPPAPIIVITAAGDAATRARQLGAAGFLGKPFDLDELSARVAAVLTHGT